jgi:hypothetical protein
MIDDRYSLQDAREKLLALGNHVSPAETLHVIKEDPDDDRILECATSKPFQTAETGLVDREF